MKTIRIFWLIMAVVILQSNSCNQNFDKNTTNEDEIWWNGLNDYWKELMLRETNHLGDKINTEILEEVIQLNTFSADHYPISDLNPVSRLTKLERLSAGSTQIYDLQPISKLTKLKSLSLPATPVEDLSPLQNLRDLEEIHIQQTRVHDLSPLRNALNLQVLVCGASQISSIEPIMDHQYLSILDISGLNIPEEEIKEFILKHPECEIYK